MRTLLVFLLVFVPLASALWIAQADTPQASDLPAAAHERRDPLMEVTGLSEGGPVGRIIELDGVQLRLVRDDQVRCYARFGRMEKHDGRPRVLDVQVALFEKRKLTLTVESGYAEGDPTLLLSRADAPRIITLGGGVTVLDAQGRELARVPSLDLDIERLTLQSDERVVFRLADKDTEIEGKGFHADLNKSARFVRIETDVVLTAPTGSGFARLKCRGPATLIEQASGDLLVTLPGAASLEHPAAKATCEQIVAIIRERDGRQELRRATLSGDVQVAVDSRRSGGLESIRAPHVVIEGEDLVLLRQFRATRRGVIPALGPEERVVEIAADAAALTLVRATEGELKLWELSLKGSVRAHDKNGPARMSAHSVLFNDASGLFEASGDVSARTVDGSIRAQRLRVQTKGPGEFDLLLEGENKRIEYVVDGKLGPLGKGRRGTLRVRAAGPLHAEVREQTTVVKGERRVVIELEPDGQLNCERLSLMLRGPDLVWLEAKDRVLVREGDREAELSGDSLIYRDKFAMLRGSPARVRAPRGSIRARVIAYRDGGAFVAHNAVGVTTRLDAGDGPQEWRIYCRDARGTLRDNQPPKELEATGTVIAMGPDGQHFAGTTLLFDGEKGEASLRGDPAVVQRGKELRLKSVQIDLRFADKELVSASTAWPAEIDFQPEKKEEAAGQTIARWLLRVPHAVFENDRVTARDGGEFSGYDAAGALRLAGRAGRAVLTLERTGKTWRPNRLACTGGVAVRSRGKRPADVTAERLDFLAGKNEVDLRGNARVKAEGWKPEAVFSHLVFVVMKDGVDLKSASGVTVKEPQR